MPEDATGRGESLSGFIAGSFFLILILFTPLVHGGITPLPLSVIESFIFSSSFILLSISLFKKKISFVSIPLFPLVLFILLVFFQLLRLPANIISLLSPSTFSLYRKFSLDSVGSYTVSIYPDSTINLLLQFFACLAVFFLALNYIDTGKKIRRAILLIILAGFAYSFYGIIRRFTVARPGFSTFTNRNHFSAYLQMIIPLTVTYSFIQSSRLFRFCLIFMASVMTLTLFLCLSRAGIICFLLSIFFLLLLLRAKRSARNRISVIIIIVLILSVILGITGLAPVIERLGTLRSPLEPLLFRLGLIKDTLKIVNDFPLWGVGFGDLGEIFQRYRTKRTPEFFSFTHNEPVQLMAETGVLGFLLISLFLIFYLRKVLTLFFKRHDQRVIYITLGCLIGLFSITMHSLFDFVFHVPANFLLFFIILGLALRTAYLKEPQELLPIPKIEISPSIFLKGFCIVISCILLFSAYSLIWRRYGAEKIFEKVKEYKTPEDSVKAVIEYNKFMKKIEKSISLNPLSSLYWLKKADVLSEVALRDDLWAGSVFFEGFGNSSEMLSSAEEAYKKAIELNPTKADSHLRLGWLYGVIDKKDLSKEHFEKAVLLDPQNPKIKSYIDSYSDTSDKTAP